MQADDAQLRTNDQLFSLTDQLNLGVRNVELDTHEVEVNHNLAREEKRVLYCIKFEPQ